MSRQNPDRSIPHLRDIFGFHGGWEHHAPPPPPNNMDNVQRQLQELKLSARGRDSAAVVSVGSAPSEEEIPPRSSAAAAKEKKKKQRSSRRDNARTLTERDVKHLERHLSMKKTIRKKIMRDLQQAFVEDPNEFRVEDIPPEKLKAEINVESLSFGPQSHKAGGKKLSPEANFLDMLRGGGGGGGNNNHHNGATATTTTPGGRFVNDDDDSGHGSPTRDIGSRLGDCEDDCDDIYEAESAANKKTSFWRRFTMKGRNKR